MKEIKISSKSDAFAQLSCSILMTLSPTTKNWDGDLPSERVQFLSLDEIVAIHERLIEEFGGPSGVRDKGLVESVLFRPQTGYYNDLVEMAVAQFESLLINHAFIAGNKRVAFFATDVLLRLNGWKFSVKPDEAHEFLIGLLERGESSFDNLLTWIRASIMETDST